MPLKGPLLERAHVIAGQLLIVTTAHVGRTRDELDEAIDSVDVGPREQRMRDGLAKLVLDEITFDADESVDPTLLRAEVFARAALARAALDPTVRLDRECLIADIARERETTPEALERALYADLRGAHRLLTAPFMTAAALVASYVRGQAQAVLLRAVKVTLEVRCASAGAARAFFHRLKFLRLLHTIEAIDGPGGGHRLVIDGPFSLFDAVTKYGLQLAMMLPLLDACETWKLEADVRWGKTRQALTFRLEGGRDTGDRAPSTHPPLADDVRALTVAFAKLDVAWRASPSEAILQVPGVGLCIPDLVFERVSKGATERVYLEVMGFWSRDAVWKRVELAQSGLADAIVFAVSSRLRVSEEVLGDEIPAALYVYKGALSARAIAEKLDAVAARRTAQL